MLLVLGLVCFAAAVLQQQFGFTAGVNNTAPAYAVTVCAAFTALKKCYRPGKIQDAIVTKIGALSLSVYLVHMIVLYTVLPHIPFDGFAARLLSLMFLTVTMSLLLSFLLGKTLIFALQWIYRKITRLA